MQRDSAKSARVYFVIPFISKSPLEVLNYPSKREKKCCRTYDFLIINATAPIPRSKELGQFQLCAQLRVCSQAGGNPVYPRFSQPDNSESWDGVGNGI